MRQEFINFINIIFLKKIDINDATKLFFISNVEARHYFDFLKKMVTWNFSILYPERLGVLCYIDCLPYKTHYFFAFVFGEFFGRYNSIFFC